MVLQSEQITWRAWCWEYFEEVKDHKVKCIRCNLCLKHDSRNTSSMIRHLRNLNISARQAAVALHATNNSKPGVFQKYNDNNPRQLALNNVLIAMVTKDYQPLSVVDDAGFIGIGTNKGPQVHHLKQEEVMNTRKTEI